MRQEICRLWSHIAAHSSGAYDPVRTQQLVPPLLVKSAIAEHFCSVEEIKQIFVGMQDDWDGSDADFLRVYVDGKLSPIHENRLLAQKPIDAESLANWIDRVMGGETFGIIVNGAERWAEDLSRRVMKTFSPLFALRDIPKTSLEITLFIGNYGYTPFGIHVDDPYTDVVHFHLGPSSKRMTLFTPEHFHRLHGPNRRCLEPEAFVSSGTSFDIASGDIFYLPAHYFHVGFTPEFSVGIAIAIGHYPEDYLTERAASRAIGLDEFGVLADDLAIGSRISVAEWLRQAREEDVAAERSRGGLKYSPRRKSSVIEPESVVTADPDFPLQVLTRATHLIIFVRGHRIRVNRHDSIERLIEAIGSADQMIVQKLQEQFHSEFEASALLEILAQVNSCGGITIGQHATAKA